ncbi:MAG: hypothetical protein ABI193_00320 [Minicystis sp.]
MSPPPRRLALRLAVIAGLLLAPVTCALGPEQAPGCEDDSGCDPGWSCREGACFHVTTGTSSPLDPQDAGDGG